MMDAKTHLFSIKRYFEEKDIIMELIYVPIVPWSCSGQSPYPRTHLSLPSLTTLVTNIDYQPMNCKYRNIYI